MVTKKIGWAELATKPKTIFKNKNWRVYWDNPPSYRRQLIVESKTDIYGFLEVTDKRKGYDMDQHKFPKYIKDIITPLLYANAK